MCEVTNVITIFIRMCGQLLLAKSWCVEEKKEIDSHAIYAVSAMKDSVVVGHLPRKISPVASLFLLKGGTILCGWGKSCMVSSAGVYMCLELFRIFLVI